MTTIWERTATALATLTPIPYGQSTYIVASGSQLPDTYLVYQLVSSASEENADDSEEIRSWTMQVVVYCRDGLTTGMPAVATAMVAQGFTRGPQRELPYNEDTRHFGLAMEFLYLEQE